VPECSQRLFGKWRGLSLQEDVPSFRDDAFRGKLVLNRMLYDHKKSVQDDDCQEEIAPFC
jgi:hypothetical protein